MNKYGGSIAASMTYPRSSGAATARSSLQVQARGPQGLGPGSCDYAELKFITLDYTTLYYTVLYFFCCQGTRKKSAGSEPNIKQK